MNIETLHQPHGTTVPYPLSDAQILEFSGTDACAFAHAQFTSDVNQVKIGEWQWSAWLDAKGRVRNLFALLKASDEQLLAWLPRGLATSMSSALLPFVFRSKVKLQPLAGYGLIEVEDSESVTIPNSAEEWRVDLPGGQSRRTVLVKRGFDEPINVERHEAWVREDIAAGLPWISAENSSEFTPQALGLERLHAVSLKKGCYPGQEIVARLHYRGGNKRGCVRLQIDTREHPMSGTEIKTEGTAPAAGRILFAARSKAGFDALAVLPLNLAPQEPLMLATGARITAVAALEGDS